MSSKRPRAKADIDADRDRIAREAAGWRARQDAGLGAFEEDELLHWLEKDVRHAEMLEEMDAAWGMLDRTREVSPEALGVTGVGASTLGGNLENFSDVGETANPRGADTLPTVGSGKGWGLLRGGSVRPAFGGRKNAWWIGSLATAAALVLVWTALWRGPAAPNAQDIYGETASVASAEVLKRLNLADGSVVRLNANSEIAVNFTAGERRVQLIRGEAHFAVAKNQTPFIVGVGDIDVRAVGTAFNVRLHREAVEVLVTEGKVGVHDAARGESLLEPARRAGVDEAPIQAAPPVLIAGEKAMIPVHAARESRRSAATVTEVALAEIQEALAWQARRLEFETAPLSEIAAEFNRYNEHRLLIADPELGNLRLGGSFRADEPDTFVNLIETRSGVVVERRPGETVLRLAK